MIQSEGRRNLVCLYLVMVPSCWLMYTPPIDKYSKLLVLKFGIQFNWPKNNWPIFLIGRKG